MGTTDIALEKVQALLKIDTGSGSLHNHVARIVRAVVSEKPDDAVAQLETLSRHIKQATYRGEAAPDDVQDIVADAPAEQKRQQWCANALQIVRSPSDPLSAPKVLGAVQNFMEDATMFEWAGVGFGKQESYHIAMSLRKLAAETPALGKLRLWGKILGTEGDYYVAEGAIEAPGAAPAPMALPGTPEYDVEPRGEGCNKHSYWVSAGGSDPWVRLPNARASQVAGSRKIKTMLKGSLGSPVLSMPYFDGKERHLLRSQIARITATCTLAPAGVYEVDEEAPIKNTLREAEGAEFPGSEALATQDGWVHAAPFLLQEGKCSWPDLDSLEEGTLSEEVINQINAKKEMDAEKGMLEGIGPDLEELKPEDAEGSIAWNIKVYGDKGVYTFPDASKSYRVTAVRSMIWPGAVTVAQGARFANLYIGDGLKCGTLVPPNKESGLPLPGTSSFSSGNVMLPLAPEDVMDEPNDLEEQEEPQPAIVEEESDKEENDADE